MTAVHADDAAGFPSFRDLGLSEAVLRGASRRLATNRPRPYRPRRSRCCSRVPTCSARRKPAPARRPRSPCPRSTRLDLNGRDPQVLVLVPTRELALQVAEAFQRYAAHLPGFHVLPIYGGQSYQPQLNALRRGVHVVVGTPGRVIDHMNRGTLNLAKLTMLVLDEADEMLQMGFIEAVECILEQTPRDPAGRPVLRDARAAPIRRIAQRHLRSPVEVTIQSEDRHLDHMSASATGW